MYCHMTNVLHHYVESLFTKKCHYSIAVIDIQATHLLGNFERTMTYKGIKL